MGGRERGGGLGRELLLSPLLGEGRPARARRGELFALDERRRWRVGWRGYREGRLLPRELG